MADRIVVMSKGFIEQVGTPLEIYNRPATKFVAGFFGMPTMNFIEGKLDGGPSGIAFRGGELDLPLQSTSTPGSRGAGPVTLGVRAEHVKIEPSAPFVGTARLLEPLGDATLVHFDAPGGRSLVAKIGPGTDLAPGMALRFGFVAPHCHLFDGASGARLS